ncbi:hypothetical protein DPMN_182478 [Dreissena polymorpha]|uniref:Uncharacterized protein n=1 Tax=Dreissena polymorpha TaxID=45954 RepID=A0A9D4DFI5_DREPO|nr:hypothetical protein DPMN_182478 [Dreissena polymorpha]
MRTITVFLKFDSVKPHKRHRCDSFHALSLRPHSLQGSLASPFIRSHDDLTVSKTLLANSLMRSHDYFTVPWLLLPIPFMSSHEDLTFSNTILVSPFMRSPDDLTVSEGFLASPFMRSHDDLTLSTVPLRVLSCVLTTNSQTHRLSLRVLGRSADRTPLIFDGGITLKK